MKGLPWGELYNAHKDTLWDSKKLEQETLRLIDDEEVGNVKGIYPYLLNGNEKHLSLRQFSEKDMRKVYEKQQGVCPICGQKFNIEEMEADHIIPWSKGGRTTIDNCQMLCKMDNRTKSGK